MTDSEAASSPAEEDASDGSFFRLTRTSGRQATDEGPAVLRLLENDCLPFVFACDHPLRLFKLWPSIGTSLFDQATSHYTELVIDCEEHDGREDGGMRRFWERIPLEAASRWGKELSHAHGREKGRAGGSLQCIAFERTAPTIYPHEHQAHCVAMGGNPDGTIAMRLFPALNDRVYSQAPQRTQPTLPPVPATPPTLPSLTKIIGVWTAQGQAIARGWHTPALEEVTGGTDGPGTGAPHMGGILCSSRCLKRLMVPMRPGDLASACTAFPLPPVGQRGPLARLQCLILELSDADENDQLNELTAVLVARGCRRTIKSLHIQFVDVNVVDSSLVHTLQALSSFVSAVATSPDIPVTYSPIRVFNLALLHDLPPGPLPPFVARALVTLAKGAFRVQWQSEAAHLSHPMDMSTRSAKDLAASLTFDTAIQVELIDTPGFTPPPNAPSPRPSVLDHLQEGRAFPSRSCCPSGQSGPEPDLFVYSHIASEVLGVLADKMGQPLQELTVPAGSERALAALRGREVRRVRVMWGRSVGLGDGAAAGALQTTHSIDIELRVPRDANAIEYVHSSILSLLKLRAAELSLRVQPTIGTFTHYFVRDMMQHRFPDGEMDGYRISCTTEEALRGNGQIVITAARIDSLPDMSGVVPLTDESLTELRSDFPSIPPEALVQLHPADHRALHESGRRPVDVNELIHRAGMDSS
ncbi:unnamed protein product [Vitrella brassicaformis CCMP3155]|uniref:Uncharacterized protein n=1 Tax=Vitrella brassicaformis (strain CCMP3155) TaxID=1169540 RepID=A0A0G4G156_VITBC|nr:unnamed protein product [Vitrella brassicaformis CCMP3155]|eukprot:CEM21723.1 unnamed protein product [Vitrella brassicaformis CCMP3155]